MKDFMVKYQYILPMTAGVLLAGIGLYYFIYERMRYDIWVMLLLGSLLNFYFAMKMKPRNDS